MIDESAMYDYIRSSGSNADIIQSSVHYEFSEEELYWQPASREDHLKEQLEKLGVIQVSNESIKYVCRIHNGYM